MAVFTIEDVRSSETVTVTTTQVRTVKDFNEVAANLAALILVLSLAEVGAEQDLVDGELADSVLEWLDTDGSVPAVVETAERTVTFSYSE